MNFAKFLRTPFLQNTSGRLLLERHTCNVKRLEEIEKMVKKMNVLYIVDQDHERSVNVVDRSITVKDIKWIVYTTCGLGHRNWSNTYQQLQ